MSRQTFDFMDSSQMGSSGLLVGEVHSRSSAKRKILLVTLCVCVVTGCIVGLVFGLRPQPGAPDMASSKPPAKQTWMSQSCLGGNKQSQCPWRDKSSSPLLVLALDGFRADYIDRDVTPTIQHLIECGVHTPGMRPVYPSLTFPNDQTIVTGLYPESHGIVDNNIYDGDIGDEFKIKTKSKDKPAWWGGEPIWVTAKKQGKRSATFIWPMASAINISGIVPDIQQLFDPTIPNAKRIDTALGWLTLPEGERPDFLTVYIDDPDKTGHKHGPNSTEMTSKLKEMDELLRRLMEGLYERGLHECVNIMIIADHGMTSTSCGRKMYLDCYTDVDNVLIFDGVIGRISTEYRREMGSKDIVRNTEAPSPSTVVSDLECRTEHFKVFTRDTLPARFHYSNNERIGDLVVDVEEGWLVYKKQRNYCPKGSHGYDNRLKSMQALFVGFGPSFKQNEVVAPFENIELYNLMCDVLGITPAPNNGTEGGLHHLLKSPPSLKKNTFSATSYLPCHQPEGLWSELQNCTCTSSEQQQFVMDTVGEQATPGLPPPTLYISDDMCILQQTHHIVGFSHTLRMPRWVATTCSQQMLFPDTTGSVCMIPDGRLTARDRTTWAGLQTGNITHGNLLPGNYYQDACGDLALSSTLVPMYDGFRAGIWQFVWELIYNYADGAVAVIAGPVFDDDHDGRVDTEETEMRYADTARTAALPFHFFLILARCRESSQTLPCGGNVDTLSFVLPHTQRVPNCLDYNSYLADNLVRIRDIELLTGLQFLDEYPYLSHIGIRLHLATALWPSTLKTRGEEPRAARAPQQWLDWACPTEGGSCQSDYKPVLLISLDGFRADYLSRNVTPVIHKLIQHGVHAPYMRPVYPTYTFPNHYTIATGLYPESHGIIDNKMFDIAMNKSFSIGSRSSSDSRWWGGEPMWLTSKRQGKKSATYFWVGSDLEIAGDRPNYYKPYANNVPFEDRVNTVVDWLSLPPDSRPEFLTLYFNQPDSAGHQYGPDSDNLDPVLRDVDDMIGLLMQKLYKRNLHNCVNIILLADHGMTPRSCDRAVALNDVLFEDELSHVTAYTAMFGRISNKYSKKGSQYTVYDTPLVSESSILERLQCLSPHMRTYRKADLPKRHHYANNDRIDNIVMDLDNEWIVTKTRNPTSGCTGGSHGEDNIYASEGALFVAHGPAFKKGLEIEPFENIEVYNLIADVLNITPAPNNGTRGALFHVLTNPPRLEAEPSTSYTDCTATPKAVTQQTVSQQCGCSNQSDMMTTSFIDVPTTSEVSTQCQVHYGSQTSVFNSDRGMPGWTTVYLNKQQRVEASSECIVPDPSLHPEDRARYKQYTSPQRGITATGMVPARFSSCGRVSLSSSVVPMFTGFKQGLWAYAWRVVDTYLAGDGEVQVTAGPIWDNNSDGLYDTPTNKTREDGSGISIPTHFFLVIYKCGRPGDRFPCGEKVDILPFILPHTPTLVTCESPAHYMRENMARLRDIELLTALRFFPDLDLAKAASLRTFLPSEWESPLTTPTQTGSWIHHTCKDEPQQHCTTDYKPLLLISVDGFRADYLQDYNVTPVIKRLSECGVRTPFMRSVYPTKTFPNHYTIVTGLYPESHGIIDNNMYDSELKQKFGLKLDSKEDPRWWQGEPIWETVMKSGKKAASIFWPGSDVKEHSPNYFKRYLKGDVAYSDRIDQLLYWLTRPADRRPDFLTLYLDEPDHTAHDDGPVSPRVMDKLKEVDGLIGQLMEKLFQQNLHNCVNIVLLADHGMTSKSCSRMVSLKSYFTRSQLRKLFVYDGTAGRISNMYTYGSSNNVPLQTPQVSKDTILENLQCRNPHLRVYDKNQFPVRHHYVNNRRIDSVILDLDERWIVSRTGSFSSYCMGGDHGYDNLYKSMGALFLAHGPAFKQQFSADTFENIEVYNLMTSVLGVTPAPNNGTPGALNHMLKDPPASLEADPLPPAYRNCSDTRQSYTELLQDTCNCSLTEQQAADISTLNIPAVSPAITPAACLLHHGVNMAAYSHDLHLPLWVAVTVKQENANSTHYSQEPVCVVADPMLDVSEQRLYTRYQHGAVTAGSLIPGNDASCSSAQFSSVVVPMYNTFRTGIWRYMWQLVTTYAGQYGDLGVTVGPVFDGKSDGRYDGLDGFSRYVDDNETVPFPTHFFVVIVRCGNDSSLPCTDQLQLLSFILPHVKESPNCLENHMQLLENTARVKDIELITGFQFFTDVDRNKAARLVTFLPDALWDAPGISEPEPTVEWKNLPCPGEGNNTCSSDYKPLLLISFDGFRADYLSRGLTPVLQRLVGCGSHSPYMRPSYPSKTFPNQYTLVTGLYPESHGIVDNTMYDFDMGKKFAMGGEHSFDPGWWGGEPLWLTAQRQGKRSATYFWPGSDVQIDGSYPDTYRRYDGSVPFSDRVETVVSWLTRPVAERPDFITLYFNQPDSAGHSDGPRSDEVNDSLRMLDELMDTLMALLYQSNLHNCVNIVITADHGMAPLQCDRLFLLSNFFSRDDMRTFYVYEGAFSHISNKYSYRNRDSVTLVTDPQFSLAEIADKLRCNNSHVQVMYKTDLPRRLHYANNDRIEGIYLDVAANWTASRYRNNRYCSGGTHGYDNIDRTMHALFLAYGPAFNINITIPGFDNIEVYNMMADVLGITAAPNNGTHGSLNPILLSPPNITRTAGTPYLNVSEVDEADLLNISSVCSCPLSAQEAYMLSSQLMTPVAIHLPFGRPSLQHPMMAVHLLEQSSFVAGFSSQVRLPLWVSYTVTQSMLPQAGTGSPYTNCSLPDPRLATPTTWSCDTEAPGNTSYVSLIPPDFHLPGDLTYRLSTSMVPMLEGFSAGIWSELYGRVRNWTETYGAANIISGPIFDHSHRGHPDVTNIVNGSSGIPSDYFTIISQCGSGVTRLDTCRDPHVLAFILPHRPSYTFNCQNATQYLLENEVRVRDVELLTGLEFFTNTPVESSAQLRTALPHTLWNMS
ncbi:uncharacterized protein [Haliotis cracherodii]|uniref:uncharacterized protein n=1 Tax=Haliotis cracherodii TaxID=6455 RepID=UPI0039E81B64